MATLTLEQILSGIPSRESYLASRGFRPVEDDDGNIRYVDADGEWINFGEDFPELLANAQQQAIKQMGLIDMTPYYSARDSGKLAQLGFGSAEDYAKYEYGDGGYQVGDYFVLPDTQNKLNPVYVNAPILKQEGNDWEFFGDFLGKAALLAGAGAALGGIMSPAVAGTESAWGVNPRAASEFSLSGATAGNPAGGLSSSGYLGLTPEVGGLGLSGVAPAAAEASGALLTPAMAASAGLPASAAMGGTGLTAAQIMGGVGSAAAGAASSAPWGVISKALTGGGSSGISADTLLRGGLNLAGGYLSSEAAKDAANAQLGATQAAIDESRRQFDLSRADLQPFMQSGYKANDRLSVLLGLDPSKSGESGYGDLSRRFTASDLENDPVYQSGLEFGLNEGRKGINERAKATGMFDSGATLKALTRYGNDYGSTKANESYNRFNTDNTNLFNRLAGLSGAGQTATNTVTSAGANTSSNIGSLLTGSGNSRAASIVGGANAWNNALTGIGTAMKDAQTNDILQKILKERGYAY